MTKIRQFYRVEGMTCASCAKSMETMLTSLDGVNEAVVNFADASVFVDYREDLVSFGRMQERIREIGYRLVAKDEFTIEEQEQKEIEKLKRQRRNVFLAILFSVPVVIIAMIFPDIPYANRIANIPSFLFHLEASRKAFGTSLIVQDFSFEFYLSLSAIQYFHS